MFKQIKEVGIEITTPLDDDLILIQQADGTTGRITRENFLSNTNSGTSLEYAQIADIKPSGNNGGSYPNVAAITRDLNTITSTADWLSLATNAFTLQPGTYIIEAIIPAIYVGLFKAWLADNSNNLILLGTPQYSSEGAPYVSAVSTIKGKIIVADATAYTIKFWASTGRSQNYVLGISAGIPGQTEMYTQVNILKVA